MEGLILWKKLVQLNTGRMQQINFMKRNSVKPFFIKSNEHTNDQEFLGVKKELIGPNQTAKHQ